MNIRTKGILSFFAVAALVAALSLLAGCQPAKDESIRDVLDNFIEAVNNDDAAGIRECLDANARSYNTALVMTYWDIIFFDASYTITSFSENGNSATVTFTPSSGTTLNYYFEMTDGGDTFYIRRIRYLNSSGAVIFD